MKERPILFSGPMVRAILSGEKTQTRRVIMPQPDKVDSFTGKQWAWKWGGHEELEAMRCPYGTTGDRLWVRESTEADYKTSDSVTLSRYSADKSPVLYPENGTEYSGTVAHWDYRHNTSPSIFMPRWASRINLKITDVRVERLQEITGDGAISEGIEKVYTGWMDYRKGGMKQHHLSDPIDSFRTLWDSINEKRGYGWDTNHFVWVIEFKRVRP